MKLFCFKGEIINLLMLINKKKGNTSLYVAANTDFAELQLVIHYQRYISLLSITRTASFFAITKPRLYHAAYLYI